MRIEMQEIEKWYGKKQVLKGLEWRLEPGLYGLLGKNGAGKTTLMRILASILKPDAGEIRVDGSPIRDVKEFRRRIGYLPQEFSVYPEMRVTEVLEYLAVLSELPRSAYRPRIKSLLEQVNLEEQAAKKVRQLSGGMKRRLGIAQALLTDPGFLIVDEPTAGLDPEERIRFRSLLAESARDRIVLLSTHIPGDVEAACGQAAVLDQGRFLFQGSCRELSEKADGKVWQLEVPVEKEETWRQNCEVLETQMLGKSLRLKILAGKAPDPKAECCRGSVENGYMVLIRSQGKEGLE